MSHSIIMQTYIEIGLNFKQFSGIATLVTNNYFDETFGRFDIILI